MKYPYTNHKPHPVYLGGRCIPSGETRMVEEAHLPREARPAPEAKPAARPADPIAELSAGRMTDIAKALPELSDADLARLCRLEAERPRPRVSLQRALAGEELRRADARTNAGA